MKYFALEIIDLLIVKEMGHYTSPQQLFFNMICTIQVEESIITFLCQLQQHREIPFATYTENTLTTFAYLHRETPLPPFAIYIEKYLYHILSTQRIPLPPLLVYTEKYLYHLLLST